MDVEKHVPVNRNRFSRLSHNRKRLVPSDADSLVLNDVQSQLNATRVRSVVRPDSVDQIAKVIGWARLSGAAVSVAGGRNSMGGQQFGRDNIHLDLTGFNRVLDLDRKKGLVCVEPGIQWPQLISELHELQSTTDAEGPLWTIRQKQTGVDHATIGGSLASNIHGRGLQMPPLVADVESFRVLNSSGQLVSCSRHENRELFSLVIGGYGLFGIVTQVTLRLVRRFKVKRLVERIRIGALNERMDQRIREGCVYGDCQYAIDLGGPPQSHEGILPCYQPVKMDVAVSSQPVALSPEEWAGLYCLTRTDKRQAFELYAQHYLRTDGQIYWSDTHQLSGAFAGHKSAVDPQVGTEVISEVCVEQDKALPFLAAVRAELAQRKADITYGTIRLIEQDTDSFLNWAPSRRVCIVVNLHVPRTRSGIRKAKQDFRAILNHALDFGGTFYLTYHRWAEPRHVIAAYPQIHDFLQLKRSYDPTEMFQNDWYRHYRRCLGG